MTRTPDASAPDEGLRQRLLGLLAAGDVDAALREGLMDFPASGDEHDAPLRTAQTRLREAWAARDRYRARQARLARIAGERDARRRAPAAPRIDADADSSTQASSPGMPAAAAALPAAAAAALARARAKAGGSRPG